MLLVAPCAAAGAENCIYVNLAGDRAEVEFGGLKISQVDGVNVDCVTEGIGTGIPQRWATCDNGYEGAYLVASSTPDGHDDGELLIFQTDIWYRRCD